MIQKIRSSRLEILGKQYSPRLIGLHNRYRLHARKPLRYKDLDKYGGWRAGKAKGAFVPGRKHDTIFLAKGADELTVAHELSHAMFYNRGFLPLSVIKKDIEILPELGVLLARLGDLAIHSQILHAVAEHGYAIRQNEEKRAERALRWSQRIAGQQHRGVVYLIEATRLAEYLLRFRRLIPELTDLFREHNRSLFDFATSLSSICGWPKRRDPHEYRSVLIGLNRAFLKSPESRGFRSLLKRIIVPPIVDRHQARQPCQSWLRLANRLSNNAPPIIYWRDGSAVGVCGRRPSTVEKTLKTLDVAAALTYLSVDHHRLGKISAVDRISQSIK